MHIYYGIIQHFMFKKRNKQKTIKTFGKTECVHYNDYSRFFSLDLREKKTITGRKQDLTFTFDEIHLVIFSQ